MQDDCLSQIRHLHGQIHAHDTPPRDGREHQAEFVINSVREAILGLVMQGVTPTTLEIALFYHWLRLTTLRRGMTEAQFNVFSGQLGTVMGPLVQKLQAIEPTLPDAGPTDAMRDMGLMIQQVKDLFAAAANRTLLQADIERHADLTNRTAFALVTEFLQNDINPILVENVLLYFWLRTSTINANVAETFFQKLERHWDAVIERITPFMDELLRQ